MRLFATASILVLATACLASEPAPAPSGAADPEIYGIAAGPSDLRHWSFQPIQSPDVPTLQSHDSVENPIDAFVLRKLGEKGLVPSPPAEPRTWLRRVTFDLIGLPPTPDEMQAFLADSSPASRAKVVDRLLSHPGYGIRWGRRWLDVVRYADTNGYERDGDKPHAWRYRDYVIDSLNADKPFDRFLTEQLAGDELDDMSAESLIATTFLRLGTWDDEPADPIVDRYEQLDDIVGTVSATFLGMTLRCARCHNHKFEPLSQIDYAKMLAIFEPLKRPQDLRKDLDVPVGTRAVLTAYDAVQKQYLAAVQVLEGQAESVDAPVRERLFASGQSKLAADALAAHKTKPGDRTEAQTKLVRATLDELEKELAPLRTESERSKRETLLSSIKLLATTAPTSPPRAYIWHEPLEPCVTQVFRRGNPLTPAGRVDPGFPGVLAASHTPLLPAATTSRRRLSLANWLTDDRHPLTARVIVNRIWQGHFGNGLVGTENDFGVMGESPTHPELLDWLATFLRQSGWRLKPLHRLICLSNTYGQRSSHSPATDHPDSGNALLWRFPYRRLEAEAIRDAVLCVSGQLNPAMGGPGVYPKIAREILEGQSRPGEGWPLSDGTSSSRRSAYVFVKRSLLLPEMELLDLADTTASCEQRTVSTIPTQALTYLNGEFLNAEAASLAERLHREAGPDREAQVALGYQLALNRPPLHSELQATVAFLDRQQNFVAEENRGSRTSLDPAAVALHAWCVVLLNVSEFVYVD